ELRPQPAATRSRPCFVRSSANTWLEGFLAEAESFLKDHDAALVREHQEDAVAPLLPAGVEPEVRIGPGAAIVEPAGRCAGGGKGAADAEGALGEVLVGRRVHVGRRWDQRRTYIG